MRAVAIIIALGTIASTASADLYQRADFDGTWKLEKCFSDKLAEFRQNRATLEMRLRGHDLFIKNIPSKEYVWANPDLIIEPTEILIPANPVSENVFVDFQRGNGKLKKITRNHAYKLPNYPTQGGSTEVYELAFETEDKSKNTINVSLLKLSDELTDGNPYRLKSDCRYTRM